jgi:hypothetical protein
MVKALAWADAEQPRLGGVVVHTIALMIVRRVSEVLGYGPAPKADAVQIAVLRPARGRDDAPAGDWILIDAVARLRS